MAKWNIKHGSWWAVQWSWNWWVGLGVHLDFRKRPTHGPYIDFHILHLIISFGRNPAYTDRQDHKDHNCRGGIFV